MSPAPGHPEADWTIDALLEARPGAVRILLRHGMACVGCAMARLETVAEAAREYHLELGTLLKEIRATERSARGQRSRATTFRGARQAGAEESHKSEES